MFPVFTRKPKTLQITKGGIKMMISILKSHKKKFVILTFILAGVLSVSSISFAAPLKQSNTPVNAILIYQSSCGEPCYRVVFEVFPSLSERYSNQMEIFALDADIEINKLIIEKLLSHYQISADAFPVFITNTKILIGPSQIENEAEALLLSSVNSLEDIHPIARVLSSEILLYKTLESIRIENLSLQQELEQAQNTLNSITSEQKGLQNFLMLVLFVGVILAIITIVFGISLIRGRNKQKALERNLLRTKKMLTENEMKFIKTLIGIGGSEGVDFLAEMTRVQFEYQQRKTVSLNAALLAKDFLSMVERYLGIIPVENFGNQVRFDPNVHRSYEEHIPGDLVMVIEPGWKFRNQILKYAVVKSM